MCEGWRAAASAQRKQNFVLMGRAVAVAIFLVLVVSAFLPFSMIKDRSGVIYEINFFLLCGFDLVLLLNWAVDLLSGQHSWGYGLPTELINFSPIAEVLAIIGCLLLALRVRPPRWLGVATLVALATSFHPTGGFEDILYPYLVGAWLWGAACLAAGVLCLVSPGWAAGSTPERSHVL
jgi:hypothetical protein